MNLAADMFIVRASEKRSFKPVQDLLAMSKIQSFIFQTKIKLDLTTRSVAIRWIKGFRITR
jgi:hypothetical protein